MFNRDTKIKAHRKKRLLIVNGHGSHEMKRFIEYCDSNYNILFVLPPHSTHTLQPLDVVCFKSLALNYSSELTYRGHVT